MKDWMKKILGIFVLGLTLSFFGGPVWSATLTDVKAAVDQEFGAGNITDVEVRDNLNSILDDAQLTLSTQKYTSLVESFKVAVMSYAGDEISTSAADRILAVANAL